MFSRKVLDRETQSQYEVPIAVTDNGGFMAFSSILVTVSDMNDNVPQFLVQEYKGIVYHDAPVNSTVLQVGVSLFFHWLQWLPNKVHMN